MKRLLKRHNRSIHCKDCAFLFAVEGYEPLCLATARFVEGPIRPDMDVKGVTSAIRRNIDNDCDFFKRLPTRESKRIRSYMVESIGAVKDSRAIDDYGRDTEKEHVEQYRKNAEVRYEQEEEFIEGEEFGGEFEDDYDDEFGDDDSESAE